ncbi:MAG: CHAT domain-containing tetratricopeptide repeat protein [Bacteroidales bacterium]
MQTLIRIWLFFSFFSVGAQTTNHSVTDLYEQTSRVYKLSKEGKALKVIVLGDSVIREYNKFPGAEKYLGYLYLYMAEAAEKQGDISLARYSYAASSEYFKPQSDMLKYIIPINLIALNLEAGMFDRCLQRGLTLFDEKDRKKNPTKHGTLLINLAEAAVQLKKFNLADSLYTCLFELIHKNISGTDFDSALAYRNFGRYKLAIGDFRQAGNAIRRSLELYRQIFGDSHYQTAKSWNALGNYYKKLCSLDSARFCYTNARNSYLFVDSVLYHGRYTNHKMSYETIYLELLLDESDLQRIQALRENGNLRVAELKKALEKITEGISRFERILQNLISTESGFILADKGRKLFNGAIRVSIDLYKETGRSEYLQKAFFWSLKAGSVSMQARAGLEERMINDDSTRIRILRLYRVREDLNETTNQDSRLAQLQEYQQLTRELAANEPNSGLSTQLANVGIKEIYKAIGRSQFICYHQLDSVFIVFALARRELRITEIPISDKLSNSLTKFTKNIGSPMSGNYSDEVLNQFYQTGVSLYQDLLKPFIVNEKSEDLLIRPDGLIRDLPFEALITDVPGNDAKGGLPVFRDFPFVIKNFRISYVSGIQHRMKGKILALRRKSIRILSCSDDRLAPEIRNEVIGLTSKMRYLPISNLGGNGFDLKSALKNADIIHFAGHVRLDQDDAMRTIMGCSGQASGAFDLSELLHIRLESDLVFINGCESAEGILNRGDGKLSPGLFFLLAGAGGVIEHRWKAPDISGSMLACQFYEHYHGNQSAYALSEAKRNYLAICQPGLDHPHYWAGMVYTSPIVIKRSHPSVFIMLYIIGISLLAVAGLIIHKRIFR